MKDFTALKQAIAAAIKANGVGAITGPVLQEQLLAMVDKMELAEFEGIASVNTSPTTDNLTNHFYLAVVPGDYTNFGGVEVTEGDCVLLYRMAGASEWSNVNLTSGVKMLLDSLAEQKQNVLSEGNGIEINDDTIGVKVKIGGHVTLDDDGLNVETTDDVADEGKIATTDAVKSYVDGQKGENGGLTPLNNDGMIDKEYMPEDVAYIGEDTTEADEMIDLYEATLQRAYQAIIDCQSAAADTRTLLPQIIEAISLANAAANSATQAANDAQSATSQANSAANSANTAAQNATSAALQATTATDAANTAAQAATQAASQVTAAGEYALNQGDYAKLKGDFADAKGEYALEQGGYAETKGDYAKAQGDYAKAQGDYAKAQGEAATEAIDDAKGDFDSLDERMSTDEGRISDVESEIETARGGLADLNSRFVADETSTANVATEVHNARGTQLTLNMRIKNIEDTDLVFEEEDDLTTLI